MIIIRREVLDNYLLAINKNYVWLSKELGYGKSYISQVVNHNCKISANVIDRLLTLTKMSFDDLFLNDGKPDLREFYGEVFTHDGQTYNRKGYYHAMRERKREMADSKHV